MIGFDKASFNPPGGFGAFGTYIVEGEKDADILFQSAGRIWGFWNGDSGSSFDLSSEFQSAGRIWGFWNYSERSARVVGAEVSIRRADLGLLEQGWQKIRPVRLGGFNPPGGFGAFGTSP
ncbi:hypothetical protein OSCT_0328 [Oscillochloris trichoides DG-6]|uniref:Uncharacterized protein n=1 Tax=Oscillochloris trichoides DG-6 TaxID=765420 RepID=E1IAH7_9CHLR|nr:hypothetical protein OSCT_0328 [Oscillochloris trichoides DG-6]